MDTAAKISSDQSAWQVRRLPPCCALTHAAPDPHGSWRLAGNEFCWMQHRSTPVEECFEVERRGNEIRLLRDSYEAFSGNLSSFKGQAPNGMLR